MDDSGLVAFGGVVAVWVSLDRGGRRHRGAHPVAAAFERLGECVQARRCALTVDHATERNGAGGKTLDQVQVGVKSASICARGDAVVFGVPTLEQPGHAVEVDEVFLHAAQEVDAPGPDAAGRLHVALPGGYTSGSTRCSRARNSHSLPRCGVAVIRVRAACSAQSRPDLVEPAGGRSEAVGFVEHDRSQPSLIRPQGVLYGGFTVASSSDTTHRSWPLSSRAPGRSGR